MRDTWDHHLSQIYDCVHSMGPPLSYHVLWVIQLDPLQLNIMCVPSGSPANESVPTRSLDCMYSIRHMIVFWYLALNWKLTDHLAGLIIGPLMGIFFILTLFLCLIFQANVEEIEIWWATRMVCHIGTQFFFYFSLFVFSIFILNILIFLFLLFPFKLIRLNWDMFSWYSYWFGQIMFY